MPVDNLHFRATCGLFLGTYYSFMAKRVLFVMKMRKRLITVRNKLDMLCFVFVAAYFLCCGDVEVNPGPVNSDTANQKDCDTEITGSTSSKTDSDTGKISATSPCQCGAMSGVSPDMATQILEALHQQKEEFRSMNADINSMRKDIGSIKTDIGHVRTKCDEIGRRCDRLEEENERLASSVNETQDDVQELFSACRQSNNDVATLFSDMERLKTEIDSLEEHCDNLESFSRRDNLRLFGVPETEQFENFDTCARLVADTLNSVEGPKKWSTDDIARAHRVGQSRDDQPKPMIVKFSRWRDKMLIIKDRDYKAKLEAKGVRVANDFTRKQASIVAEARKEGKVAFFRRGKLMVGPRRPDPRTYAEVAAVAEDVTGSGGSSVNAPSTQQPTKEGGRGHKDIGCDRAESRNGDKDFVRRTDEDSRRSSGRGVRVRASYHGNRSGSGAGRRPLVNLSQSSPPVLPVNKSPGNNPRPRRSARTTSAQ